MNLLYYLTDLNQYSTLDIKPNLQTLVAMLTRPVLQAFKFMIEFYFCTYSYTLQACAKKDAYSQYRQTELRMVVGGSSNAGCGWSTVGDKTRASPVRVSVVCIKRTCC